MTPDAPKRTFFRRLFRILPKLRQWLRTRALYRKADYLEAYAAHTDMRVQQDPHSAIGGKWEAMGKLQFDFLVRQGLQAQHSLLDIGCGTLRGGRHFIRHLDAGNYTGLDISPGALDSARSLVKAEGLESKRPMLVLSEGRNLRFEELYWFSVKRNMSWLRLAVVWDARAASVALWGPPRLRASP